ncbi:hypothetical protein GT370_01640 [Acidocella sp. MX-AZ03]|uniref:hypothetical protein n=1 Tax=Acidocella sp. MX-AZ03 TaxID=2697363 RepID=UPI0022DCFF69|nr:hypothetical protein [Acidocella sp. MX-AZ03]WBO59655.1 hypothetical protein GT370_01640 [Acidocella sp. MX-AZ03]
MLALPSFVAAPAHRTAVEAFASRLTGRDVHISGKLSLSYFPQPEITATGITISGPDKEVITAHALSLDLALAPLLQGQLAARTLDLDTPNITFPWPLPGASAPSPRRPGWRRCTPISRMAGSISAPPISPMSMPICSPGPAAASASRAMASCRHMMSR